MARIYNVHSLDWDDTELIRLYNRGKPKNPNEEVCKLFVGGLNYKTSVSTFTEYFEKFGNLVEATIKTDVVTGQSKGFGFITYEDSNSAKAVLNSKPHSIDGREITVSYAESRKDRDLNANNYLCKLCRRKLKLWGLGDNCRAVYPEDDCYYEGQIVGIDGGKATIKFHGFQETVLVKLTELQKSFGRKEIKKQKEDAKKSFEDQGFCRKEIRNTGRHRHPEVPPTEEGSSADETNDGLQVRGHRRHLEVPPTMPASSLPPHDACLEALAAKYFKAGYYDAVNQVQNSVRPQPHCCHCTLHYHHHHY